MFRGISTIVRYHLQIAPQIVSPYAAGFDDNSFSDVAHSRLLQEISGCLRQKYLVPYQNNSNKVTGVIYGPNARPMICLPVRPLEGKGETLSVHFLVDTGFPNTFLAEEALKALFSVGDKVLIESTNVNIWGTNLIVSQSTAHWQGINILGADYLRKGGLILECTYHQDPSKESCTLEKR
jgi:hypothetical protein